MTDITAIDQITDQMQDSYCRAKEADKHRSPIDGHWFGTEPGWHEQYCDAMSELTMALGIMPWQATPLDPHDDPKARRLRRLFEAASRAKRQRV
jgi:hypothetical protein